MLFLHGVTQRGFLLHEKLTKTLSDAAFTAGQPVLVKRFGGFIFGFNKGIFKLLGKKWQHYKHAEHIYHFNPKTLGRVLDEAGFDVLENSPRLGGKYISMGFVAERAGRLHPVFSALLSPLKLFAKRSVYVNLYDEMIVVAKPRA